MRCGYWTECRAPGAISCRWQRRAIDHLALRPQPRRHVLVGLTGVQPVIVARPRYHADAAPTTHNRLHWCQAINHARDSIREIVVVTAHVNYVLLATLPDLAPQARQLIDGSEIVEHGDGPTRPCG